MFGIYKITNKLNNNAYIGKSNNIEKRWAAHKQRAFHKNSKEYDTMLFAYIEKELGISKKETVKRNKKESKVLNEKR